ncbi:hypothetical protein RHSIM_Rhsim07G0135500 [Rhododendron simsii]|uniref:3-dehydroquinate synthase N-terminal domain-containing protein n=1 Tax=Rhododendron simsii TaxID=118357 RepID=A0A834GKZ5_RHOSS|nr:hypothetical protein RHSIM_Rhsim07G0135500 [Rhododendron simsii]
MREGGEHDGGRPEEIAEENPNVSLQSVILPDGEKYKNMDILVKVFDKAIESRLDRQHTFIALGGGVIGGMCGCVAASFLRGFNVI